MTVRPTIGANRVDTDIVTATDWNRDVLQQGLWAQEVIAGTNTDKIPAAGIVGAVGYWPNMLVNGGFEIAQRGTAFTLSGTAQATLDKWNGVCATTCSIAQFASPVDAGSQYSLGINYTRNTANDVVIYQNVENYKEYAGQSVSVYARVLWASIGSGTGLYITLSDGVTSALTSRAAATGVWQTLTATLAVNAAPTQLQVAIRCDATTFFYVDNVMFVRNATPIPYVARNPAEELLACERFYQKVKTSMRWKTQAVSGEVREQGVIYRVPMAAVPSVTVTAGTRNNVTTVTTADVQTGSLRYGVTATAAAATDTYAQGDTLVLDTGAI